MKSGPSTARPKGPRRRGRILLAVLALAAAGLAAFTFLYARGGSYLSDDPSACANCHIMRGHFDDWNRASHRAVAVCNDCHVPKGFLGHWTIKGIDGFKHSYAFTTGFFKEPIRITAFDRGIVLANCRRCHGDLTAMMTASPSGERTDCLRCHRGAGH